MKGIGLRDFGSVLQGIVVVDFYSVGCRGCAPMERELIAMESRHKSIKFYKVNVEIERSLAGQMNIMGLPTVIVFDGSKQLGRFSGTPGEAGVVEKRILELVGSR